MIEPEWPTVGEDIDTWGPELLAGLDEVVGGVNASIATPAGGVAALTAIPDYLDNMWRYQQASYSQDNIVTLDDGTTYAVWIRTADLHAIIGKLEPGAAIWETFDLRTIAGDPFGAQSLDGHNTFTIGSGTDGRIHVAGNMHGIALRYAVSTNPGDITAWLTPGMVGSDETSVTYPLFVNTSTGVLHFVYRSGTSGLGDVIMNRWTGAAWVRVATVLDGTASDEGPYVNHVAPNALGGFDFMFMWRLAADADTNTDPGYVRYTGSGWVRSDGSAQTMPVTHANAETVLVMPEGTGLVNQTGLDVDTDGHPHGAFMWYDVDGNTQYFHVWHDGEDWNTEQVTAFTDRVETIGVVGTLALIVARPQIVTTAAGKVYMIGRARSTARNRAIIIDVTAPGHPYAVLFDMGLTEWEPAFDQRSMKRDETLRMLVTDLDSPATAGQGFERQWGGILTLDVSSLALVEGSAPKFGIADAGRSTSIMVRGSLAVGTDLNGWDGVDRVGAWLMGTGVTIVNQPGYGVTRPAMLVVEKPHPAVVVQKIIDVESQVFMRFGNNGVWGAWTLATGGSLAAVANGTTIVSLWHGDYLLSSGANAYPGEPTDFAALNVAGILEVRLVASSGTNGTKFYRLTTFDRTEAWEATSSGSTLSAWLQTRGA